MPIGTGDPALDAMLKGAPEQTPSSLYPLLHGQRTQDINLPPPQSLKQILLQKLGLSAPQTPEGNLNTPLLSMFQNRDQKMMDAKPKPGSYPLNIPGLK